jgi:hypothetical protein
VYLCKSVSQLMGFNGYGVRGEMSKTLKFGSLGGLKIMAKPSAFAGFALVWLLFSLIGRKWFKLGAGEAAAGGFFAALVHMLSELWHHAGHATAAKQTGYPMSGVCFVGPLATSLYPPDEPPLPPETHMRRALGGPIASALLALVTGLLALALQRVGGLPLMVAALAFLDNLLVFTLGAFLPLGFTDGDTLRRYLKQMQRPSQWLTVKIDD